MSETDEVKKTDPLKEAFQLSVPSASEMAVLTGMIGAALYVGGSASQRMFEFQFGLAGVVEHDLYELMQIGAPVLPVGSVLIALYGLFVWVVLKLRRHYWAKWGWTIRGGKPGRFFSAVLLYVAALCAFSLIPIAGMADGWWRAQATMFNWDGGRICDVRQVSGVTRGRPIMGDTERLVLLTGRRDTAIVAWDGVESVSCRYRD